MNMINQHINIDIDEAKRLANRAASDYANSWLKACFEAANAVMRDDTDISTRLSPTLYYASPTRRVKRLDADPVALIQATMALVAHEAGEFVTTKRIDFEAGAAQLLTDYAWLAELDEHAAPCDLDSLGLRLQRCLEDLNDPTEEVDEAKTITTLSRLLVELSVALHEAQQDDQCD